MLRFFIIVFPWGKEANYLGLDYNHSLVRRGQLCFCFHYIHSFGKKWLVTLIVVAITFWGRKC